MGAKGKGKSGGKGGGKKKGTTGPAGGSSGASHARNNNRQKHCAYVERPLRHVRCCGDDGSYSREEFVDFCVARYHDSGDKMETSLAAVREAIENANRVRGRTVRRLKRHRPDPALKALVLFTHLVESTSHSGRWLQIASTCAPKARGLDHRSCTAPQLTTATRLVRLALPRRFRCWRLG